MRTKEFITPDCCSPWEPLRPIGIPTEARNFPKRTPFSSAAFSNATGDSVLMGPPGSAGDQPHPVTHAELVSLRKSVKAFRSLGRPADSTDHSGPCFQALPASRRTVYLTETIARDDNSYALRLNAFRCVTDDALASANGDAASRAQFCTLSDCSPRICGASSAKIRLRAKIRLTSRAGDHRVLEALKAFTEGRRLTREQGAIDAVPALKKSVDLDPRFALLTPISRSLTTTSIRTLWPPIASPGLRTGRRQTLRDRLHITTLYYDLGTGRM